MKTWASRAYDPAPLNNSLRERIWEQITAEPGIASPPVTAPARHLNLFPGAGRWAIGGVATAIAAVGGTMYFLPGTPIQPVVAFARVEEAMGNVQTATWNEVRVMNVHNKQKFESRFTCWASLPLARLTRQETFRSPDFALTTTYWDGGYTTSFNPKDNIYSRHKGVPNIGNIPGRTPRDSIREMLLFPRADDFLKASKAEGADNFNQYRNQRSAWTVHKDTLHGQEVLRFESRLTQEVTNSYRSSFRNAMTSNWKIWVDPKTYRIQRREIHVLPSRFNNSETFLISENFRYNLTPPRNVFTLPVPPVGKSYQFQDYNRSRRLPDGTHTQVTLEEEEKINTVLRKAVAAWNRRDRTAFATLWDFRYSERMNVVYNKRPFSEARVRAEERKWLTMMEQGKPFKIWPPESIGGMKAFPSLFERRTESDPFPPPPGAHPDTYLVTTKGIELRPRPGTSIRHGHMFMMLRTGDNFRLIYMETPVPQYKPSPAPSATTKHSPARR